MVRKERYALDPYIINKIDVEIPFCSCIMSADYGWEAGSQLLTSLTFGGIHSLEKHNDTILEQACIECYFVILQDFFIFCNFGMLMLIHI